MREVAMLVIREAQMQAMRHILATQLFESALVRHLRKVHGSRFRDTGELELQGWVRHCIKRSAELGLADFPDCARFVELVIEFGPEFPMGFDWAEECLAGTAGQSPGLRVQALMDGAARHLDEIEARRAREIEADGEIGAEMFVDDDAEILGDEGEFGPVASNGETQDDSAAAEATAR
jgi:hypothetical protein